MSEAAEREHDPAHLHDLAAVLDRLSRAILRNASHPDAAPLRRVIAAQSLRFPELARLAYEQGWLRAVDAIAKILRSFQERELATVWDPQIAAELFLSLLLGPSSRSALYGVEVDPDRLERQRLAAVDLFVRGVLSAAPGRK
jgi:hypothetical protein